MTYLDAAYTILKAMDPLSHPEQNTTRADRGGSLGTLK
jgi:hypothetical protein